MYKISPNVNIEVTKDGLKAYIIVWDEPKDYSVNTDKFEFDQRTIEEIIGKVKEFLKVGLKEDKLWNIFSDELFNEKILIAEGITPIDGKDGYIKYHFDLEKKISPKVLEDGTVDYRELDIIRNVKKGDILAELIPAKEGKSGSKVTGEPIPYKKGRTPLLKYGKNVRLLEDGVTLVAEKDGHVEVKNGKVVVLDVFEVENVDNKVGNIYFNGTVVVRKNAYNGYQIKADGDVIVNGIIEGAYVENEGDVVVKRGIQGHNKLTINSAGNVTTRFIENAIINSKKSIRAEAIMHSNVYSNGDIILIGKKGLIVGGICRAGGNIHAKTIGSSMATKTVLEVGIDPDLKKRYEELSEQIKTAEDNLDKVIKSLEILNRLKTANRLDNKNTEMLSKLLKTRETLESQLMELKEEYQFTKSKIDNLSNGKIKVSDTVYPGVRIVIGNSSMTVRDELKRCTFYRDEGEIRIGPYWE